jgi:hypothetical protein
MARLNGDGLTVEAAVKDYFFDRAKVRAMANKIAYRALYQAGSHTRQTARRDVLRRRKAVSQAGSPPSVHSRDQFANLRNILYAFSPQKDSVIVGPRRLNQVNQDAKTGGSMSVPAIHEFGGTIRIREVSFDKGKTWFRHDRRFSPRPWHLYRDRLARYPRRPFMGPAFRLVAPKFPQFFGRQGGSSAA